MLASQNHMGVNCLQSGVISQVKGAMNALGASLDGEQVETLEGVPTCCHRGLMMMWE